MGSPFDELLDFTCTLAEPGRAEYTVSVGARHHNPTGRLHGGMLSSLADAAMGAAFMATFPEGGTNLDLALNFLRPTLEGELRAVATFIKQGKTLSLMQCEIFDADDRLVATARSQFLRF